MARWNEKDLKRKPTPIPHTDTSVPQEPDEPSSGEESGQIGALPAERPGPIRWEVATGLHAEQFGARFRLVVVGPAGRLGEVTDLLKSLPPLTETTPQS